MFVFVSMSCVNVSTRLISFTVEQFVLICMFTQVSSPRGKPVLTGTQILTYFPCFTLITDSLTSPPLSNQVELKKLWRSYTDTCITAAHKYDFGTEASGLHIAVALAARSSRVAFTSVCWQRLWVWRRHVELFALAACCLFGL